MSRGLAGLGLPIDLDAPPNEPAPRPTSAVCIRCNRETPQLHFAAESGALVGLCQLCYAIARLQESARLNHLSAETVNLAALQINEVSQCLHEEGAREHRLDPQ